ncbi:MAG TPA: DNA repair protein Rad50, partial [Armatimonadota bacterium]|nr:DNA repair protein Rad50 [Armatimonadota bacterium]
GRIIASDGAVRVLREENGRVIERDEERLSRGARDALMLCARLAAIEQAVDRLPLPVVLDDALVNLDRRRHERALRIVARLAEKTQVLLFTCHEHTMALLRDAGVAHHPILLPGKASAGA